MKVTTTYTTSDGEKWTTTDFINMAKESGDTGAMAKESGDTGAMAKESGDTVAMAKESGDTGAMAKSHHRELLDAILVHCVDHDLLPWPMKVTTTYTTSDGEKWTDTDFINMAKESGDTGAMEGRARLAASHHQELLDAILVHCEAEGIRTDRGVAMRRTAILAWEYRGGLQEDAQTPDSPA